MDAETRRALSVFVERTKTMREGGAPASRALATVAACPRLQLVTAENADSLRPQRKRRARPGKIAAGGNVVAFPQAAPRPTTEFDRQKLRVAELLVARQAKDGRPRMGTKAMLAVVDAAFKEARAAVSPRSAGNRGSTNGERGNEFGLD